MNIEEFLMMDKNSKDIFDRFDESERKWFTKETKLFYEIFTMDLKIPWTEASLSGLYTVIEWRIRYIDSRRCTIAGWHLKDERGYNMDYILDLLFDRATEVLVFERLCK